MLINYFRPYILSTFAIKHEFKLILIIHASDRTDWTNKRYKRGGGKMHLSVENRDENARGHEGVDNPSHPSRRILLWFRSILRRAREKTVTDKRENKSRLSRGSADTRKHMAGTVQERNAISSLFEIYFNVSKIHKSLFSFLLFVFIDRFAHHRYLFGNRAKVRRAFAKYLLQSIAKLTAHKSTLESITATDEIEQLDHLYLNQQLSRYSFNNFESSIVFIYFNLIIFRWPNLFKSKIK